MIKKLTLFLFVMFSSIILFPNLVNAECSEEEKHDLNKLVENIQVKYEHTGNNLFKVTLYNVPDNITGSCMLGMFDETTNYSAQNFIGGYLYNLFFIANEKNECGMAVLNDKKITIPIYNIHFEKEICKKKKYNNFEYCQEFVDKEISEEEFNKKLLEFDKKNVEKEEVNNNFNIVEFLKDNILFIGLSILTIVIVAICVIYVKRKKSKI